MSDRDAPTRAALRRLPRSERGPALQALVGSEFKRALLMSEQDELPLDENYFDLGLTSLRASEIKERLETRLECELDTSVLFSCSTVRQVVDHVAAVVLPDDRPVGPRETDDEAPQRRHLVDDLLRDLYGR